MIQVVHFSSISSMLCKCVYEKCLLHSKRPKNYCVYIYIYLRDIMQQWYYTQGEIDILVQPSTQQQRHSIKDNIGWRSKTTEKSDVKQKRKDVKRNFKNQVISSIPSFFDNEFDTTSMITSWEKIIYIWINKKTRKMKGRGKKKKK